MRRNTNEVSRYSRFDGGRFVEGWKREKARDDGINRYCTVSVSKQGWEGNEDLIIRRCHREGGHLSDRRFCRNESYAASAGWNQAPPSVCLRKGDSFGWRRAPVPSFSGASLANGQGNRLPVH